jgi:endonuclease/exonuclease/phosphatase family metal-dependent hydrolase
MSLRDPTSPDENSSPSRTISAVSINLAKETEPGKILRALHDTPRLVNADLFLLQEVVHGPFDTNVADEIGRKLAYFASFAAAAPGVHDQGLAILSQYPLTDIQIRPLKPCDLGSRSRSRFALGARVRTPWGDLPVWNTHLDTRINADERLEQLQPSIDEASRDTGPRLIGGDFKTNEMYWLRNRLPVPGGSSHSALIRSAMRRNGFEHPVSACRKYLPSISSGSGLDLCTRNASVRG